MKIAPKIQLTAAPGFEVKVGDTSFGYFRQTAEMEGMKRLVNADGQVIVIDTGGPFMQPFVGLFGDVSDVTLIKASVQLAAKMIVAANAADEVGVDGAKGVA